MDRIAYFERCEARGEVPDDSRPLRSGTESSVYEHRVSVNYLRHVHTEYERLLGACRASNEGLFSGVRSPHDKLLSKLLKDAVPQYRSKMLKAIAAAYPHLRAECERQERERCTCTAQA